MSPEISAAIPPPAHLSPFAVALWTRVAEQNKIDSLAEPILLTLCEAFDRREEARMEIRTTGAVFKDRFGAPKMNPWCAIERDQTLIIHRAFRLLGGDVRDDAGQGNLF